MNENEILQRAGGLGDVRAIIEAVFEYSGRIDAALNMEHADYSVPQDFDALKISMQVFSDSEPELCETVISLYNNVDFYNESQGYTDDSSFSDYVKTNKARECFLKRSKAVSDVCKDLMKMDVLGGFASGQGVQDLSIEARVLTSRASGVIQQIRTYNPIMGALFHGSKQDQEEVVLYDWS